MLARTERRGGGLGRKRRPTGHSRVVHIGRPSTSAPFSTAPPSLVADPTPNYELNVVSKQHFEKHEYISLPQTWWRDPQNQRTFLAHVATQLGVKQPQDWYQYSSEIFRRFGGTALHSLYDHQIHLVLQSAYPPTTYTPGSKELHVDDFYPWQLPWNFQTLPRAWWADPAHQRLCFESIRRDIGLTASLDQLYVLSLHELKEQCPYARPMVGLFKSSPALLRSVYPEHIWIDTKFKHPPLRQSPERWRDGKYLRDFLDEVARENNFRSLDDFYKLTHKMLPSTGRSAVREAGSLRELVAVAYPEHSWQPWKFDRLGGGFWQDETNIRAVVEWLRIDNSWMTMDDLYNLSAAHLNDIGARYCLEAYRSSVFELLKALYPWHEWLPWRFAKVPRNWWTSKDHQMEFINYVRTAMKWQKMEDLYQFSVDTVVKFHGWGLMRQFNQPPALVIAKLFPEHKWNMWRFSAVPVKWWNSKENQRAFLDWLRSDILKFASPDQLYTLSQRDIKKYGGSHLLAKFYQGSPAQAVMALYPEHSFVPWKFNSVPKKYWDQTANRKKYLEWVKAQNGWTSLDDFYNLEAAKVNETSSSLLQHMSIMELVRSVYPEHTWEPWRFAKVPNGFWDSLDNQRAFVAQIAAQQDIPIADLVDADLIFNGGQTLLRMYGSLSSIFRKLFPDMKLDETKIKLRKQPALDSALAKLYPKRDIEYNARVSGSGSKFISSTEVDLLVKSAHLGFEFQGQRHFFDHNLLGELDVTQARDEAKVVFCSFNNIRLVEVPYWWNSLVPNLAKSIDSVAPS